MDEYIEQLLKDAGIPESTDKEVKEQLASDLKTRAMDLINRRLIDSMNDQDLAEFEKLLDSEPDNTEAMQKFIDEHVPDKEEVVARALLEFRALYLGTAA